MSDKGAAQASLHNGYERIGDKDFGSGHGVLLLIGFSPVLKRNCFGLKSVCAIFIRWFVVSKVKQVIDNVNYKD